MIGDNEVNFPHQLLLTNTQNVQYVTAKNQDLLKNKKQKGY